MNKKGFTLMELLLVVAILAIVAAAAAPTFSQGASDALREARKSSFLAAYQNTVTGAHMMVALGASKGYDAKSIYLDNAALIPAEGNTTYKLDYYAPLATRQFKNDSGNDFTLSARVDENHKLIIIYQAGLTAPTSGGTDIVINTDSTTALNTAWKAINTATTGN
jgi:prepilin-type N-terminal cleavage/methylation domain-containing protein